jgi:hypothetical protein
MSQSFLHKVSKYSSLQSNYFVTLPDTDDKLVLNQCQVVCKVGKDLKPSAMGDLALQRSNRVNALQNRVHSMVMLQGQA